MSNLGNKKIMAKNIRYYMDIAQVTQTEICATLGIKMPTFSDWVNAKTYPRIDKIELMANYFGISKADLVEDRASSSTKTGPSAYFSDDEIDMTEKYRDLDSYGKAVVEAVLELEHKRCQENQRIIDPSDRAADEFLKEIRKKESETNARSHA